MAGPVSPPPPDLPELPAGAAPPAPNWPWWFAFAAFALAVVVIFVLAGFVGVIAGVEPDDDPTAAVIVVGTLIQAAIFTGVALFFASLVARPRAWHFGLRRTALWPAVGWAALGLVGFYVFAVFYNALVRPDIEQTVAQDLGAGEGTLGLIVAGCMVMIVAPLAEEFFFRGFFYRALRSRLPVFVAGVIDGVIFGFLHIDYDRGLESLLFVPPLALLGLIFCLVYEKTGSLWPVVAMHAFNNAVAYGVQADGGWQVSVVVGPLMLVATVLVPRLLPPGPKGARPLPAARPQAAAVQ